MFQQFTRAQKLGAIALLGVFLLLVFVRYYLSSDGPPTQSASAATQATSSTAKIDLNAADTTALQSLKGIGPVLARRIVRYRALIGGFKSTDQLLQVYGITPEKLIVMEEQLTVDSTNQHFLQWKQSAKSSQTSFRRNHYHNRYENSFQERQNTSAQHQNPFNPPQNAAPDIPAQSTAFNEPFKPNPRPRALVDINQADSAALVEVPGIGPASASRIVKYRERMRFFSSLDQLSEVWGLRPENIDRMKTFLTVAPVSDVKKIPINTADVETMGRHPYIGFKHAKILIAYREMHGPFKDMGSVRQVFGIDSQAFEKMEAYIRFD